MWKDTRTSKGEVVEGICCYYYDTVIDKCSSQENLKVVDLFDFPEVSELIICSDNVSCFTSHNKIPCFHALNAHLHPKGVRVSKCICVEACIRKNRLDTHFSFVAMTLIS